ncbi:hypothetical protein VTN00DRAFT_6181 [Thermoascus crustaceus]|uniref:uncharacterized protein n=1 Tax=Thermoascus crustaceus TaxID=5088 RepID=UPI003742BEB3
MAKMNGSIQYWLGKLTKDATNPSYRGKVLNCNAFRGNFVKSGKLQEIFNKLPGDQYPDLTVPDHKINEIKGNMFAPKLEGFPSPGGGPGKREDMYRTSLSLLNTMSVIFSMPNDRDVAKVFRKTHNRIYDAFVQLDEGCITPRPRNGWADAYSSWMKNYLQTQGIFGSPTLRPGYVYALTDVNSDLAYGCTSVSYLDIPNQRVTVCAGGKTIVNRVLSL